MSSARQKGWEDRSTFVIQKMMTRISLGRMARSTGTNDPQKFRDIGIMVDKLIELARENDHAAWWILKDLRDGDRTFLETLALFEDEGLKGLKASVKTVSTESPITEAAFEEWVTGKDIVEGTRRSYRYCFKALSKHVRKGETMNDLPSILNRFHVETVKRGTGQRQFNLTHNMVQGWVKSVQKVTSPVYQELRTIERFKTRRKHRDNEYFSPTQIQNVVRRLPNEIGRLLWFQACHSMNTKELLHDGWKAVEGEIGLFVDGRKNEHRQRTLPRMADLPPLPLPFKSDTYELQYKQYLNWVKAAAKAAGLERIGTHDFRRSYTRWADEAGIPQYRISIYTGHSAANQTSQYQYSKVPPKVLEQDGEKLRAYIAAQLAAEVPDENPDKIVRRARFRLRGAKTRKQEVAMKRKQRRKTVTVNVMKLMNDPKRIKGTVSRKRLAKSKG